MSHNPASSPQPQARAASLFLLFKNLPGEKATQTAAESYNLLGYQSPAVQPPQGAFEREKFGNRQQTAAIAGKQAKLRTSDGATARFLVPPL